jgi:hypothetical protein
MNIFQKKTKKVFIPCHFVTGIFGYWVDESGKLYKDNIIIQSVNTIQYNRIKNNLFKQGEKAIFYTENGTACIEDKEKTVILKKKHCFYDTLLSDSTIKRVCKEYGGCTVYTIKDNQGEFLHYKIEYWY